MAAYWYLNIWREPRFAKHGARRDRGLPGCFVNLHLVMPRRPRQLLNRSTSLIRGAVNPRMRFIAALIQIPIYCLIGFSQSLQPPCGQTIGPHEAYERATAVFVGKVISVTRRFHPATRMSPPAAYDEVKFQTEKSWKLVDRNEVTVETENAIQNTCGSFTEGETYLVYADRLNDTLYVSRLSRTNRVADAAADLQALGAPQLSISSGRFHTYRL